MSWRYSCVWFRARASLPTIRLPSDTMRTSSASNVAFMAAARMIRIHGLICKATSIIENGHPCGIPHFRTYGVPTPPAKQLYTLSPSTYLLYALRTCLGIPAMLAILYTTSRTIWSKNFRMSAAAPQNGCSSTFICSMSKSTLYHASVAPLPGTPAYISVVIHWLIHGCMSFNLMVA